MLYESPGSLGDSFLFSILPVLSEQGQSDGSANSNISAFQTGFSYQLRYTTKRLPDPQMLANLAPQ
jgi:hypothetical protein